MIAIRDLSPGKHKYTGRVARVQVSRTPKALANWDKLWVHSGAKSKGVGQKRAWRT